MATTAYTFGYVSAGVATQHASYAYHLADWCKIRDAVCGERAIHDKGEVYLPKLSKRQSSTSYDAYKSRARFFGASKRTLKGWVGSVFRKAPSVEPGDTLAPYLDDIDLAGTPFTAFARARVQEVLSVGRAGILVDHQKAATGRTYLIPYKAEEIINWYSEIVDGRSVLTMVVVRHDVQVRAQDGFGAYCQVEYRFLGLVNGVYQVTIYRANQNGVYSAEETYTPEVRGKTLDFIPFVFMGPSGLSPEIEESPLLDLVTLNLHHYQRSGDLAHGLHFSALPTYYTVGDDDDGEPIELGPGVVHNFRNKDVKPGVWEFSGAGLGAVRTDLEDMKAEMGAMGASMVTPPKREAETAEALTLKSAEQNSPLAAIAQACEEGLTLALRWLAQWEGIAGDVQVRLSKDFNQTRLSSGDLTALSTALQAGTITPEVYAVLLADAEMLPPDMDPAEFAAQLEEKAIAQAEAKAQATAAMTARLQPQADAQPAQDNAPTDGTAPPGTVRVRKDGTYRKEPDGSWTKVG